MIETNDAFILIFFIVLILGFLIFLIIIYNRLIQLKNNIAKSWSNIDISLKQRSDELPNLINTVKGYMTHEKTLLENITKARSYLSKVEELSKKAAASEIISESLKSLFAVAERYPDLKAIDNFSHLQIRITALENEIADRREYYNECVTIYNTRIHSFPDFLITKMFKFKDEKLFIATEEDKRYVKVNF